LIHVYSKEMKIQIFENCVKEIFKNFQSYEEYKEIQRLKEEEMKKLKEEEEMRKLKEEEETRKLKKEENIETEMNKEEEKQVEKEIKTKEDETKQKGVILYEVYYKQNMRSKDENLSKFKNIHIVDDVKDSFHFEDCINESKILFSKICPTEEFLPPLKDPESDDKYDKASKYLGIDLDDLNEKKDKKKE
jgi:hypothetical protein